MIAITLILASSPVPMAHADPSGHTSPLIPHTYDLRAVTTDPTRSSRVATHGRHIDAVLNANLLFGKDSDELQAGAHSQIATLAKRIRSAGAGTVTITGHTDDLGTVEHGLDLSRRRAQAVAQQLGSLPDITVRVDGRGEDEPAVPNVDEAHRAQNRRVEVHFTPAG